MSKNVVVIGSGIGGLSAAAALAKKGYKVKVLESTASIGGYCQSFKRNDFKFITSVHKIGVERWSKDIDKFIELLTNGEEKITWRSFNEFHIFGDKSIDQGYKKIDEKLIEYFPSEEIGIKQFFSDFRKLYDIMSNIFENNMSISKISISEAQFYLSFLKKTIEDVLDEYFNEKLLKDIILSSIELEKDSISLTIPPVLFESKYCGDFFVPENGMDQVLDILKKVITKNNGEILTKSKVDKIIIENNQAKGVLVNGEFIEADYVVSGIDILKTYKHLIGEDYVAEDFLEKIDKKWPASNASYGLWIGLDCPLEEIGMSGECLYYYPDIDSITESKELLIEENGVIIDNPPIMINSNFSNHEGCTPKGKSQLTVGFITSYSSEENWGCENGVRGLKYKETKKKVTEKVLKVLEKRIPNIREHIEVIVDATPMTYERYSGNRRGAYTGYRKKAEYIFDKSRHKNESNFTGLYFSSHWVAMQGGILYTFLQGFNTANIILGNDGNNNLYCDNNLIGTKEIS